MKVMERSPKAFDGLDEEGIRSHFLVQLNGHYEGQATGETFNYQGKTDILIRSGDRNIFIAECKFWGGPQMLTQTIDQLLGYLSWRDFKTAILLFNRNRDFSKVLDSIPETVRDRPGASELPEGRRSAGGDRVAVRVPPQGRSGQGAPPLWPSTFRSRPINDRISAKDDRTDRRRSPF